VQDRCHSISQGKITYHGITNCNIQLIKGNSLLIAALTIHVKNT
ncbi:MAG: hypothetical protein ACJAQ7_001869, partial [Sediminicola sp.]